MKSIVLFNQKGGVGKTSTVVNVMAELVHRNYSVLAIDLDPQCNLTAFCGCRSEETNATVCEWLLKEKTYTEVVKSTRYGDLIPASDRLQYELMRFSSIPSFVIRIRDLLKNVAKSYDYIIMDCPPAVNQVTAAALVAADYVLVPTEAELFSASGVKKIAETIDQVKPLNPEIKVLGVLLVKYQERRNLTKDVQHVLELAVGDLLHSKLLTSKIRFTVEIPAAQASGYAVLDYKPNGHAASDYHDLVDEMLEVLK